MHKCSTASENTDQLCPSAPVFTQQYPCHKPSRKSKLLTCLRMSRGDQTPFATHERDRRHSHHRTRMADTPKDDVTDGSATHGHGGTYVSSAVVSVTSSSADDGNNSTTSTHRQVRSFLFRLQSIRIPRRRHDRSVQTYMVAILTDVANLAKKYQHLFAESWICPLSVSLLPPPLDFELPQSLH